MTVEVCPSTAAVLSNLKGVKDGTQSEQQLQIRWDKQAQSRSTYEIQRSNGDRIVTSYKYFTSYSLLHGIVKSIVQEWEWEVQSLGGYPWAENGYVT